VALVLAVIVPTLDRASGSAEAAAPLTARVAATGGIVGVIFAVIVFLMVYQPGS